MTCATLPHVDHPFLALSSPWGVATFAPAFQGLQLNGLARDKVWCEALYRTIVQPLRLCLVSPRTSPKADRQEATRCCPTSYCDGTVSLIRMARGDL